MSEEYSEKGFVESVAYQMACSDSRHYGAPVPEKFDDLSDLGKEYYVRLAKAALQAFAGSSIKLSSTA